MQHSRRQFLGEIGSFAVSYCAFPYLTAQQRKGTRIILLGTKGGPSVGKSGRSNPSTLILINDSVRGRLRIRCLAATDLCGRFAEPFTLHFHYSSPFGSQSRVRPIGL